MKKLKQIIGDGVALAIPMAVIAYVLFKAHKVMKDGIGTIAEKLGIHELFGKLTLSILALVAIMLIILAMGLLMQLAIVNRVRKDVESVILKFFPSLNRVNAMMADRFDREEESTTWKPVILHQSGKYRFAFLIEEKDELGVFFVVKGSTVSEGDTEILEKKGYSYTPVVTQDMKKVLNHYCVGATDLVRKTMK